MKFLVKLILLMPLLASAQRYPSTNDAHSIWTRAIASSAPTNGQCLTWVSGSNDWEPATCGGGGGSGTVTSVNMTVPSFLSVSGNPITTAGTLTVSLISQTANSIFAAPNGSSGNPAFRSMVNADLPASGVTAGSYLAANITVNSKGIITAATNGAGASGGAGQVQFSDGSGGFSATSNLRYNNGSGASAWLLSPNFIAAGNAGTAGYVEFDGTTSGNVKIVSPAAPTSWTFTLPTSAGSSGNVMQTNGAGVTSWVALPISKKEIFTLSGTDITNQYICLINVAQTDSIDFLVRGGGVQVEGASYDYSVSYTDGSCSSKTKITFLNALATGGLSALVAGDKVVVKYLH